jgi:cell division protease FtsH
MAERLPPKKLGWGMMSKNLMFWILIILVSLVFYQTLGPKRDEHVEIPYSTFRDELEENNVARVEITSGKLVEGDFKQVVPYQSRDVTKFHTVLPIQDSELLLERLEEKNVTVGAKEPKQGLGTVFLQFLPWVILIGLWIFFFRQVQQGGNRAFSFGKSKAKLLTGDTPKVTFQDVAGADEAKVELEEVIEFLKDPQKFQRLGGRLPKGVLLVGPPGTGKTLLARAVAGEAGRPFFSMSGSDFVEMFVGVGASRVRDLFEQGKAHAPCIIFIDEIDAVGRHRGAGLGGGHAATNRPDVLDPALLRPGRFDRQIVVDMPDVRGREMILKVHVRKIPLGGDVRLEVIARATPGLAGADLANIVNESALLAARRDKSAVDMEDFEDAKDKVMLGVERKSMVLSDEERKLTAYHEAGHALVSIRVPGLDPVHKVSIVPRGRALGLTFSLPEEDRHNYTKEYIHGRLAMAYGGRVAEELIFGREKVTTGAAQDIHQATEMARRMVAQFGMSDVVGPVAVGDQEHQIFLGREFAQHRDVSEKTAELVDQEIKRILGDAYERAEEILKGDIDTLHRMAEVLLERETIDREEFELIAEGKELPSRPAELPSDTEEPTQSSEGESPASDRGPVLGTPPAEPAGA